MYVSTGNGGGDCDEECGIIIGSVLGGVFGLMLIVVLIYYIHKQFQRQKALHDQVEFVKDFRRVEMLVTPYLDANPHVIEMGDHVIPKHLQEMIPGLTEKESRLAVSVVAKRRVELC
jgi:hypothetical protein